MPWAMFQIPGATSVPELLLVLELTLLLLAELLDGELLLDALESVLDDSDDALEVLRLDPLLIELVELALLWLD